MAHMENTVSLIDLDFSGFSQPNPNLWTSTPSNNPFVTRDTENMGCTPPLRHSEINSETFTVKTAKEPMDLSPEFIKFKNEAVALGLTNPESQAEYILNRLKLEKSNGVVNMPSVAVQGPKLSVKPFDPSREEWEVFIHRFERLAGEVGWNQQQMLLHLVSSLEGRAAEVYRRTDRDRNTTYSRLRDELERAFAKTSEQLAEMFQKACIKPTESAIQFATDLEEKFRNWYARANANQELTVHGLLNHIVREQFLKGLPRECRLQIKQQQLLEMSEISQYAENYLTAHREIPLQPKKTPVEPSTTTQSKGNTQAHAAGKNKNFRCWQCKTNGHSWRDCSKKGTTKTAAAGTTDSKPSAKTVSQVPPATKK